MKYFYLNLNFIVDIIIADFKKCDENSIFSLFSKFASVSCVFGAIFSGRVAYLIIYYKTNSELITTFYMKLNK